MTRSELSKDSVFLEVRVSVCTNAGAAGLAVSRSNAGELMIWSLAYNTRAVSALNRF